MLQIHVTRAEDQDIHAIAEISAESAREGMVKEFKPEELKAIVSNDRYYVVTGRLDREVVGYAVSTYSWGKLHVIDVAVRTDRRRMGVGKAMIGHLISHSMEKGLPEVYCEVRTKNVTALNLFAGLGFRFRLFSKLVEEGFYGLYLRLQK